MNSKRWGEFDEPNPQSYMPKMNFNSIIELASQPTPNQSIMPKQSAIELPMPNLAAHTVQLQIHAQLLRDIVEDASAGDGGSRLDVMSIPPMPEMHLPENQHPPIPPLNHVEKEYCDFSKGIGSTVIPVSLGDKRRILHHCAAISLAQIGVLSANRSVVETLADSLDHYLLTLTKLMRSVADREAINVPSGFPDIISKVFTELGITGIHEFYQNRVVKCHDRLTKECYNLLQRCQKMANEDIPEQLKLEDVPELHFPAALGEVFTPSLEPGFQMLHSLEQEELQGLDLLETEHSDDNIKIEVVEYSQQTQ